MVLAAGLGSRLAPLTRLCPKALCPVGGRALLDHALGRLDGLAVAVNAHHGARQVVAHLEGRDVHVSFERDLLGTAGALGALKGWLGGRDVVVANADACHSGTFVPGAAPLGGLDRSRPHLFVAGPEGQAFGPHLRLLGAYLPWRDVAPLPAAPCGLYDTVWAPAAAVGRLVVAGGYDGAWFDCGTPRSYLAANLWASGGEPVVGEGARVEGTLVRCVVWAGAEVRRGEVLVDAVRAGPLTVLVRAPGPPVPHPRVPRVRKPAQVSSRRMP